MPFKLDINLISIDSKMTRVMPLLPLLGLVLGFILPGLFIHLRPWTPWLLGVITFSGTLRLRVVEFGGAVRNPLPLLVFFLFARAFMPFYVMFISSLFFGDIPDTITGFVLLYSAPTAISVFIWVTTFGGDRALGLSLALLDNLLSPLLMPVTASVLMGARVDVNTGGIMLSLFYMMVLPAVIGIMLNEASRGKIPALISPYFNPIAKICMVLIVAANTASALPSIQFNDSKVWRMAAFCIFFLINSLLLARLVAHISKCNYEKSIAFTFPAGQRNISVAIAIATGFFPEAAALPALISIMFQQVMSGLIGKLLFRKSARGTAV